MVRLDKCIEEALSAARPEDVFRPLMLLRRHDLGVEYARQFAAAVPDNQDLFEYDGFPEYWLLGLLQAGEPEQAWAWLRDVAPEVLGRGEAILADEDSEQDDLFYKCCPELYAWLLLQTGQEKEARSLLQRMAEAADAKCAGTTTAQRRDRAFRECSGQFVLHGFLGHREETLAMLRRTFIEDGGTWRWWFFWDHGALNFLQDDPEYQEIMQAVEDRLAVQRERVREMERNGELPMAQWEIEARQAAASLAQARNGTGTAGHDERR